ncbi:hypothetical protein W911_12820 [Hyphomicrobium nitrativorans NL23]|uniref:Uncharacterized protein n=1 Tax=Hyphomicrobium nitrativorans NL23 TaxID=1029756 RepID=V5SJK5_9HYPH|nr:hypothetical protein W911_12820 [Hyphomicrobium nitrativorans NL23]
MLECLDQQVFGALVQSMAMTFEIFDRAARHTGCGG